MSFHVPNKYRVRVGDYGSDDSVGNNGLFRIPFEGKEYLVMASDGGDWEHVSISIVGSKKTPSWNAMAFFKNVFWGSDDWVMQFHPAEKDYVNLHHGCLHLWRPMKEKFPTPPKWMVGF